MERTHDEYLRDEYLLLQNLYESYDQRSLTIKSWVIGGTIAGLSIGAGITAASPRPAIWVVVGTLSLFVWYLEGRWKMFQHALRARIRVIEAYFRKESDILPEYKNPIPFQTYHWWFMAERHDMPIYPYEKAKERKSFAWRVCLSMFQDPVWVPYLPIIVICALFLMIHA
jgi:hypothetical protein